MNKGNGHRLAIAAGVIASATTMVISVGGVALGTTGDGVTASVLGRGTAVDKIKTRGNQPFDVVTQSLTIAPGGHTGWHSHPGQAIVVIKSGTFTTYDADDTTCTPEVYQAGQVYVDSGYGHAHIARNEGTVPLELHVTLLDVPVGKAFRIDQPASGHCGF